MLSTRGETFLEHVNHNSVYFYHLSEALRIFYPLFSPFASVFFLINHYRFPGGYPMALLPADTLVAEQDGRVLEVRVCGRHHVFPGLCHVCHGEESLMLRARSHNLFSIQ